MYLVSIYFDEKTNQRFRQDISQVAKKTGNSSMIDGQVPPHITVSAFDTTEEQKVLQALREMIPQLKAHDISFVSIGSFLPSVIYVAAVYDEHLHQTAKLVYNVLEKEESTLIHRMYRPFQWLPHVTIGKKMTKEQLLEAFQVLQNQFGPFEGKVIRIGIAKTNPYREIRSWNLEEES